MSNVGLKALGPVPVVFGKISASDLKFEPTLDLVGHSHEYVSGFKRHFADDLNQKVLVGP